MTKTAGIGFNAHQFRFLLGALIAAASIVSTQGTFAAGLVFSDNFESGNTSKWTFPGSYSRANVVSAARDGGAPRSGTKMLETNSNGTVTWQDPNVYSYAYLESWPYAREFLLRLWVRYDADVDNVSGNKILRMGTWPSHSFYLQGTTNGELMAYFEQVDNSSGPIKYFQGNILNRGWHKVELYVKHNATGQTDGTFRVWWDGTKVIEATNIKTIGASGGWTQLNVQSNWSPAHDANNHVYWDDVEIFSDLGVGGSGLLADATIGGSTSPTLPAPTNLR